MPLAASIPLTVAARPPRRVARSPRPFTSAAMPSPHVARHIPAERLHVSEPPPHLFGNPPNPGGEKRGWSNANWLKSRFHFSFAEYSNHKNASFGVLRVMNDDLVMPKRGFGEHGHADMEIVTYIVEGRLTHQDSTGTSETLGRGAVQFMTAGRGVRHSERNLDASKPLRFIQMWIVPNAGGLPPNYGSHETTREDRSNRWCRVVSPVPGAGTHAGSAPVQINQDASISVAELDPGVALDLDVPPGRQTYLLCVEGECVHEGAGLGAGFDGGRLARHDAAELGAGAKLRLVAGAEGAHLLAVEMKEQRGSGREDL